MLNLKPLEVWAYLTAMMDKISFNSCNLGNPTLNKDPRPGTISQTLCFHLEKEVGLEIISLYFHNKTSTA